jgi:hypothetical protein
MVVGVGLVLFKAEALAELLHHRGWVIAIFGLFFAVGTVLMARQDHGRSRVGGSALSRP